jgi:hypothetical protein
MHGISSFGQDSRSTGLKRRLEVADPRVLPLRTLVGMPDRQIDGAGRRVVRHPCRIRAMHCLQGSCASLRVPMLSATILIAMSAGCGSSAKVDAPPASVGQQLQDLDEARDKGLLTEAEYQQQRRRILEGK